MLFKKKQRKRSLAYGVFVKQGDQEKIVAIYKDERNAKTCLKVMREDFKAYIRMIGLDF